MLSCSIVPQLRRLLTWPSRSLGPWPDAGPYDGQFLTDKGVTRRRRPFFKGRFATPQLKNPIGVKDPIAQIGVPIQSLIYQLCGLRPLLHAMRTEYLSSDSVLIACLMRLLLLPWCVCFFVPWNKHHLIMFSFFLQPVRSADKRWLIHCSSWVLWEIMCCSGWYCSSWLVDTSYKASIATDTHNVSVL